MSEVHPLLRKALALTLLGALVMLAWVGLLQPLYLQYQQYEESIDRSRRLIERYAELGAAAEELAGLVDKVRSEGRLASGYLSGESVELAGADMQEHLKRIVENSGGLLASSQMLAVETEGETRKLGIRVAMRGDIETLQKALYDFETASPYFFVDQLTIQASRWALREARGRSSRRQRGDPSELQVRFDVYAFMRGAG